MSKYQSGMYVYMPTPASPASPAYTSSDHKPGAADVAADVAEVISITSKLDEMQMTIADSIRRLDKISDSSCVDLSESIRAIKEVAKDLVAVIKTLETQCIQ